MSGSRLRAARGSVSIDDILPGEEVVVVRDGEELLERVQWVGHSTIDLSRHPFPDEAAPVRFRPHAIADNQPERDLLVSPEHCMIIDGLCVPAKYLVNGGSIISERGHAPFTYYHVELERHGALIAENALAESFLSTGSRENFDNGGGVRQLYPRFVAEDRADRWLTDACAPLARLAEDVPPIWTKLARRSAEIGHPLPELTLQQDADVHLEADGKRIAPSSVETGSFTFVVPAAAREVLLRSNFCIPADRMIAEIRDTRRLGIRVQAITIRTDEGDTILAADYPGLGSGWHEAERSAVEIWRWTNGAATIPWPVISGPAVVTIRSKLMDRYPLYDEKARLVA